LPWPAAVKSSDRRCASGLDQGLTGQGFARLRRGDWLIELRVQVQGTKIAAASIPLPREEVDELLSHRTEEVKALAHAIRDLVRAAVPNAFEVIYHGAVCYGTSARRSTLKVYISFHTSHVNLGFYFGATLPDIDRLLEGEGKQMRHIKIRSQEDIKKRSFQKLLRVALEQV